jgi:hypothetical protein
VVITDSHPLHAPMHACMHACEQVIHFSTVIG